MTPPSSPVPLHEARGLAMESVMRTVRWWLEAWRRQIALCNLVLSLREAGPSMNCSLVLWWERAFTNPEIQ